MSARAYIAKQPGSSAPVADEQVALAIGGMTCGACVARVERALNGLEGVAAQVNYATERATVALDQLARMGGIHALTEQEHDLLRLSGLEHESHLECRTRIPSGAEVAGQGLTTERHR